MNTKKKKSKLGESGIADNRKAFHDYHIEERLEAGLVLAGWEVKSLRAGRVNLKESYVTFRAGEAWLIGMHVSALLSASTHVQPDPTRTRKLLLQRREIARLIGLVQRDGYTVIPLNLHWSKGRAKLAIGVARGKQKQDKRQASKARDWTRHKDRLLKQKN